VTKLVKFILILILLPSCSLNDATGFWSQKKKLKSVENKLIPLSKKEKIISKEFNINFLLKLDPSKI